MTLWLDAHLSPRIARWVTERFRITAKPVRELGLREAEDADIWTAARDAQVVLITKDSEFEERVRRLGPPPQVIWLTCGNTSEARLKEILEERLEAALVLLGPGSLSSKSSEKSSLPFKAGLTEAEADELMKENLYRLAKNVGSHAPQSLTSRRKPDLIRGFPSLNSLTITLDYETTRFSQNFLDRLGGRHPGSTTHGHCGRNENRCTRVLRVAHLSAQGRR